MEPTGHRRPPSPGGHRHLMEEQDMGGHSSTSRGGPHTPQGGGHTSTFTGTNVGGRGYPVLVRLPHNQGNFSLKIRKYFGSKKSDGGENCDVTEINPREYQVCFQDPEAQARVLQKKDHMIEGISVEVTIGEGIKSDEVHNSHQTSKTPESADLYTENRRGNDYRDRPELPEGDNGSRSHPTSFKTNYPSSAASAGSQSSPFPEIFSEVSARLITDLINGGMLQEIKLKFTALKMIESDAGIEVTGPYRVIEELHDFLQRKLGGGVRTSFHEDERKDEGMKDCLVLQTDLYDYIAEIYKEEVTKIESRFSVKLIEVKGSRGSTYLKLIPLGPNSSVEQAEQMFTNQVQVVTKDWHQKEVPISTMKAPLEATKQYMKKHHKTLVIEDRGHLILRGPDQQLTLALEALEKGERSSLPHQRVITISPKEKKNEVLVDARHMDILKKLRSRKIEELQQKYSVRMDEKGIKDRNVIVTFSAVNGALDLGAHACHSFTNLLQSTIINLQRKAISVNLHNEAERLTEFMARLQKSGIDVILEHDQGSVTIIASPLLVDFVENKFREFFKIQDAQGATASEGDTDEAMDTSHPPDTKENAKEEVCAICLDQMKNRTALPKCKHEFCDICLKKSLAVKPVCPVCSVPYGVVIGNQPDGTMTHTTSKHSLPGFDGCGTICINYNIPGGIQEKNHPSPGKGFSGTQRTAYLPDNQEGREVLHLLRKAFDQKLIFTVGESRTTGYTDTVTWNDIHHKTNSHGGPSGFGYPDPNYLKRVRDELKAKGIE